MTINEKESCYGCFQGYWVSDRGYGSYYCPFIDKYDVGEQHIQGKIDIEDCWIPIPLPKLCPTCGKVLD